MGHSDSMSPAKSGASSSSSSAPSVRAVGHAGSGGLPALEKPVHHDNPVEPVRVKLQDPVGYPVESLWSSEGLKSRSSLLFSTSQALGERPASFALRAPRLQSKADARSVYSGQTTPPSESDEGDTTVDNQKEDQEREDTPSENAAGSELSSSWGTTQKLASKGDEPTDNQELESQTLSLNLQLRDRESAVSQSSDQHPAADIWTNPHDDFEDGDFNSAASPTASPDRLDQDRVAAFPRSKMTSSRPAPTRASHGDSDTQVGGCRVPPGMSLFDRIQEDFPRTPSPEYGRFEDGGLPSRRPSFGGRDQQTEAMFGLNEGMGHLKLGNYRSAPPYDSGCHSGHDFGDLPRVPQQVAGPRFAGANGHRHTFVRSTSEPPFGGSYHGAMAQGFSPAYATSTQGVQGYPVMMDGAKSRWAANEDAYSFSSAPFGFAPSDYASSHSGHSSPLPGYPVGYPAEFRGTKPSDKMIKARPSYPLVDHPLYERHEFAAYAPRPQMLHRPKVGGPRRSDFEYFHPVTHSYSSNSLLEEFNLAPKSEKWGLSAIKGHLFIFAKDQTGSRFIQQKLEKADERLKAEAFNEIFPNSLLLMTDVFGNYVIQKFLEFGSLEQQQLLVELMTSNMISLALQVYGCRVIQRALEVTQVDEQLELIRQLKGHVMKCVVDQNGNHVLQKCIEAASWKKAAEYNGLGRRRFVNGEDIQFIIDSFIGHAAVLSMHSYGCRVIQRVLEHCAPAQIRPLLNEIIFKCRELVKDQFGNYVVQHVISHGEPDQRNIVMQAVLPEIARWSQHKYASNVVESCLEHATKEEISQIVDFILHCDDSGASCALLPMMKHMYGNYVVQKLLERADDHDRHRIICIIRHNEDYLKRFTFGKHVLSRLEREEQASNYY